MFHVEDIHAQNIGRVTVSGDVGKREMEGGGF